MFEIPAEVPGTGGGVSGTQQQGEFNEEDENPLLGLKFYKRGTLSLSFRDCL